MNIEYSTRKSRCHSQPTISVCDIRTPELLLTACRLSSSFCVAMADVDTATRIQLLAIVSQHNMNCDVVNATGILFYVTDL